MLRTELTEESCLEYMEASELNNRETNKAIKSGQKIEIHILPKKKEEMPMANKHTESSTSLVIGEMQMETTVIHTAHPPDARKETQRR